MTKGLSVHTHTHITVYITHSHTHITVHIAPLSRGGHW